MTRKTAARLLVLHLAVVLCWCYPQSGAYDYGYATNPVRYTRKVRLKQGALQGVVVEPRTNRALPPVEQFLGIPYAASPTRELRFMPPGSAPSWFGTKIADSFGPVCPQRLPDPSTMTPERAEYFERLARHLVINQSEDCLYLNIYSVVQDLEEPLPIYPVMVFLHGESYEWNSGNPYDGSVLAAYGRVIVVTLNFRLGAFGFLKTGIEESAATNFALVDQVAALLWVQENIASFGGDPDSVTLFGHGTGAVCANLLMLSNMINQDNNRMLFRRVILMGGTALADWALNTSPRQITYQVASSLNCPTSESQLAECLTRKNYNDIVNVSVRADYFRTRFGPIGDGRIIPSDLKHGAARLADLFKRFELMYGVSEVESAYFTETLGLDQYRVDMEADQELMKYLRMRCDFNFDVCHSSTLQEYEVDGGGDRAKKRVKLSKEKLMDILSDARTVAPVIQMGRLHSVVNPQSYFYVFAHTTASKLMFRNISFHGDELPYVFGIPLDGPKFHFTDQYTPRERLFSEVIMTYFTNFVHSGNPNVPRKSEYYTLNPIDWLKFDVEWPDYDLHNESYIYLSIPPEIRHHYRKTHIRYWNEHLPNLLQNRPSNTYKPSHTAPSWLHPKPISKSSVTPRFDKFDKFDNFYKPPTHPTSAYGTIKYKTHDENNIGGKTIEFGTVRTSESDHEVNSSSATNLLVIVGCLFLLVNILIFVGLYYKCVKLKNKANQREEEYQNASTLQDGEKKLAVHEMGDPNGCNLMRMINSKSTKSEDTYEAIKMSEAESHHPKYKLTPQNSISTIDPHTKVKEWIAQEIVQKCSPRYLRRVKKHLELDDDEEEHHKKDSEKTDNTTCATDHGTMGSDGTLGQSPTRPVSPAGTPSKSSSGILARLASEMIVEKTRPPFKRSAKVSVAIDATPSGRGPSVLRQQPVEFTKSLDYQLLEPKQETQLRRSFTLDDVVNVQDQFVDSKGVTVIRLKQPNLQSKNGLPIAHQHSKSDPVQDLEIIVPVQPRKLKTFDPDGDVNVTSREDTPESPSPLTAEQQLQTIKRRNFPKVLPDFPQPTKDEIARKRLSMPTHMKSPTHDFSTFGQGKSAVRVPPVVPPRTSSTLGRNVVHETPAALAEEPPFPEEPEVTYNNLYIGPLIPTSSANPHAKKSGSSPDIYKHNLHQIYEPLKPLKTTACEQLQEKKVPKTIVTANMDRPIKRSEPKVVIKPTLAKKSADLIVGKTGGARVIARNSSDEKMVVLKGTFVKAPSISEQEIASSHESEDGGTTFKKTSQIPTLVKGVKKESSSSESTTPSEESDTGTIIVTHV